MNITVHRGGHQIGGCITEIESDSGTRILIDLGQNLPGIGEEDPLEDDTKLQELLNGISAVIYTHNHGDHLGYYWKVPEYIHQYIGEMGKEVIQEQVYYHRAYKRNRVVKNLADIKLKAIKRMQTYHTAQKFKIGDISITPFLVSHSASDSYMLLIQCDNKTILHTGDFRDHGFIGKGLYSTIEKYIVPQQVDVLITEGTMLSRPDEEYIREYDIQKQMEGIMKKYRNVFILCTSSNFDRIVAAHNAHLAAGHGAFICDNYQQHLLQKLAKYSGKYNPMFNIQDAKEFSFFYRDLLDTMCNDGFTMLIRYNVLFWMWTDVITRMIDPEHSIIIYSTYPGYIDPGNPAYNPSLHKLIKAQRVKIVNCHTTGHAYIATIAKVCEMIHPSTAIIPIHKEGNTDIRDILSDNLKDLVIDKEMCRNDIEFKIH